MGATDWERRIEPCRAILGSAQNVALPGDDRLNEWLEFQAATCGLRWLFGHADDGVIWGEIRGGSLFTSHQAFDALPQLRLHSLRQVRLFNMKGEVLLWRAEDRPDRWRFRIIHEVDPQETPDFTEAIDEQQILWGTHMEKDAARFRPNPATKGFTLVADGVEGLRHAPPVSLTREYKIEERPLRLQVRHYVAEDKDKSGFARIVASRLCRVFNQKEIGDASATTM